MENTKSIKLTSGVNNGETVVMTFTLEHTGAVEDGHVVTEIKLNSYGSRAVISFGNLTPEVLRDAANKLEQLMKGE